MNIIWDQASWDDYLYWQNQDKKTLRRINKLIQSIMRSGNERPLGKAEILKHSAVKACSVRIDKENRLVYVVNDNQLYILSCKGHYTD